MTLTQDLKVHANPEKAKIYQRFFKTGKGQYGEGDIFLGITVPETRAIAKKHNHLPLNQIEQHLKSKYHEERLAALLILVHNYPTNQNNIANFYLKNTDKINNWDLVDLSAHKILGKHLQDKDKSIIYKLAKSDNLWERRIAIISTFHFINQGKYQDSLKISKILLKDKHDLIHKAVGWMLREIGKKNQSVLEAFLKQHYKTMPRTMLRYAIEKFSEKTRKAYLNGTI
jgi:3-methyladenine DNA glycosylase AlkD